ncbi:MAG: hypothetical protein ABIJ20_04485 [Nanoarchaeota archaeon]|nr:hypothetical protein [Nanoarchaeota archaeon]MBU1445419.1 hypothetical protein [Nanoarchaeota archaeon]MBU2406382.1 hypothetical protein [Nanoarchaeota archaeon]MBU2420899.1 hypothetical protein [Nanoarchaeota archaeon]MBU2475052.1 hypothetical protein [Nanoarchaeota archaeon]
MTNVIYETERRLKVIDSVTNDINSVVRAICIGGSMGFGQYYSIRESSDIDMVVVVDQDKVDDLVTLPYFQGEVPDNVVELFKQGKINLFWVTKEVDDIEVGAFVYETGGYLNFCTLQGGITGYIDHKPELTQDAWGFDGVHIVIDRNVIPCGDNYSYSKPALVNGKFWGGVPRADFFYLGHFAYEEGNFLTNLEKVVWEITIKQLVNEHGFNVDLSRFNVLNSVHPYNTSPEKLPPKTITNIQEGTIEELAKINQ